MKVFLEISAWLHIFVRQFQRECCHKPLRKVGFQGSKLWPDSHCSGCIESIQEVRTLLCLKDKDEKVNGVLDFCIKVVFFH